MENETYSKPQISATGSPDQETPFSGRRTTDEYFDFDHDVGPCTQLRNACCSVASSVRPLADLRRVLPRLAYFVEAGLLDRYEVNSELTIAGIMAGLSIPDSAPIIMEYIGCIEPVSF